MVKEMSVSGKYIAKMFSLKKKLLVSECFLILFLFLRVVWNQGYVSR